MQRDPRRSSASSNHIHRSYIPISIYLIYRTSNPSAPQQQQQPPSPLPSPSRNMTPPSRRTGVCRRHPSPSFPSEPPHPIASKMIPSPSVIASVPALILFLLSIRSVSMSLYIHPQLSTTSHSLQSEYRSDYQSRLLTSLRSGHHPPRKIFLRWLHIPKTGTSFVNTLIHWAFNPNTTLPPFVITKNERPAHLTFPYQPTITWDWLHLNKTGRKWLRTHCRHRLVTRHPHYSLPYYSLRMHASIQQWEIPHTITFFRHPPQRIYSNYIHLAYHYNPSHHPIESLQSFLLRPQFHAQQTKLLLSHHYRSNITLDQSDAYRAAGIVNRLAFVGLTEHFVLSVRLFHAVFGGVPNRRQFENIRPGIKGAWDEAMFGGWRDQLDEIVYEAARNRFWNDVRKWKNAIEKDGLGHVAVENQF